MLPTNNPCNGCRQNCCDPIVAGIQIGKGEIGYFPLNENNPFQLRGISTGHINMVKGMYKDVIDPALEQSFFGQNEDFTPRGISLVEANTKGEIIHNQGCKEERLAIIQVINRINMVATRFIAFALFDCKKFDKQNGTCKEYNDRRPSICTNFTPIKCGRSKHAEPWQIAQSIKDINLIQSCMKNTVKEAIEDLALRMHRQY